ncbi:MAG: hypothetical protein HY286_04290 [Planctomycetes bacterium]|nr:hypothetical protein [Planctomycetota bacterium]
MAEVALPTNQIFEFLAILAKRRWAIIIPALWGLTLGLVALCFIPKRYESKTIVRVGEVRFEEDPNYRMANANPYKDLQNVKIQILAEDSLHKTINDRLQWADYLAIVKNPGKRKKFLDEVRERSSVELAKKVKDVGVDLITITYKDEDPKRAADFLKILAEIWRDDTQRTLRDQISGELVGAQQENANLTAQLNLVQRQIKELQEEYKLSPTQASNRGVTADEDWVVVQYKQAKSDQIRLEAEVKAATERFKQATQRYAEEPPEIWILQEKGPAAAAGPSAADGALAKSISDQLTKLRAEVEEYKGKLEKTGKIHPRRKDYQKKVDGDLALIKDLEEQQKKNGFVSTPGESPGRVKIINDQKRITKQEADRANEDLEVKKALLKDQLARTAELEDDYKRRPEIFARYHALESIEENTKKQLSESSDKVERKKITLLRIDSVAGNPYRTIEEPVPAESASEPSIPIILAIGFAVGAAIGLAWIFVREFVRPSFRSVHDVASALSLPVLGMVNRMMTIRELRRNRMRGLAGIGISLMLIAMLGGTAGLYLTKPDKLPSHFVALVNNIKQKFH